MYENKGVKKMEENGFLNDHHPELMEGEIFLCNARLENFIVWKTKRRGSIAYTINGERTNPINGLYPVFVRASEIEAFKKSVENKG